MNSHFSGADQWHQIASQTPENSQVTFADGSSWEIYSGFAKVMRRWSPDDLIKIKKSKDPEYPWRLVNVSRQESVDAKLLSEG